MSRHCEDISRASSPCIWFASSPCIRFTSSPCICFVQASFICTLLCGTGNSLVSSQDAAVGDIAPTPSSSSSSTASPSSHHHHAYPRSTDPEAEPVHSGTPLESFQNILSSLLQHSPSIQTHAMLLLNDDLGHPFVSPGPLQNQGHSSKLYLFCSSYVNNSASRLIQFDSISNESNRWHATRYMCAVIICLNRILFFVLNCVCSV